MSSKIRSYVYLFLSGIFLGAIGVFVKLIGDNIHYMTLIFYRILLGFVFLLIVVPFLDRSFFKVQRKDLFNYFIIAVLMVVSFSMYVAAIIFAPIHNVILISNLAPFLILIWAYFLLKEKITKTKIITLFVALFGIAIINPFQFGTYRTGNILILFQTFVYSWLVIWMRRINKEESIGVVLWFFFFSLLLTLPFPFIFGWGDFTGVWYYVLGLGIFSTGLAYLLHNLGLQKIGAEISSLIIMVVYSLSGILLAIVVLGEVLDLHVVVGGLLLIFAAIYLQAHNSKLRRALKDSEASLVEGIKGVFE